MKTIMAKAKRFRWWLLGLLGLLGLWLLVRSRKAAMLRTNTTKVLEAAKSGTGTDAIRLLKTPSEQVAAAKAAAQAMKAQLLAGR